MTRKRQASKPEPEHYDDPLGLDDPVLPDAAPLGLTLTGLCEEADAMRIIRMQFEPDLLFCPNCETVVKKPEKYHWCDYCGDNLRPIGTKPRTKKVGMR